MNLKKAKEVNQDIGTIKTIYLKNQEEFIHETGFPEFYTQQEHTENWFHTTRINGLGDIPFLSQGTKTWPQGVHTKESLKGIKLTTSVDATITKPNREKKK
ncbi:hypothetical protein YC2023_029031 [Brassica napus]